MKFELPSENFRFLSDFLVQSEGSTALGLIELPNSSDGRLIVLVASNSNLEKLQRFTFGGLRQESLPESTLDAESPTMELWRLICEFMPGQVYIDDPAMRGSQNVEYSSRLLRPVILPDETFALSEIQLLREADVKHLFDAVGSWHLWGFVKPDSQRNSLVSQGPPDNISTVAVQLVFAEVYDGEGYMVWLRQ